VSFKAGLIVGAAIAGLQVLFGHGHFEYQHATLRGNPVLALAIPAVLVPLAIVWGWTWVSDHWSGRSTPRLLLYTLYTLGLVLGVAAEFPAEYLMFPPTDTVLSVSGFADRVVIGIAFALPVVALAAALYWAFGSGRVSIALPTLALSYFAGLSLALILPTLTMGTVAGTAAGHAWRSPGARTLIAILVVLLMLVGTFELPLAAAALLTRVAR